MKSNILCVLVGFLLASFGIFLMQASLVQGQNKSDTESGNKKDESKSSDGVPGSPLFTLANHRGETVFRVVCDDAGYPRLELLDPKTQTSRMQLRVDAEGSSKVHIFRRDGSKGCELGMGSDDKKGVGIGLLDSKGKLRAELAVSNDMPSFGLVNESGTWGVYAHVDGNEAGLAILDGKEQMRIVNQVRENGNSFFSIRKADGSVLHEWKSD